MLWVCMGINTSVSIELSYAECIEVINIVNDVRIYISRNFSTKMYVEKFYGSLKHLVMFATNIYHYTVYIAKQSVMWTK